MSSPKIRAPRLLTAGGSTPSYLRVTARGCLTHAQSCCGGRDDRQQAQWRCRDRGQVVRPRRFESCFDPGVELVAMPCAEAVISIGIAANAASTSSVGRIVSVARRGGGKRTLYLVMQVRRRQAAGTACHPHFGCCSVQVAWLHCFTAQCPVVHQTPRATQAKSGSP